MAFDSVEEHWSNPLYLTNFLLNSENEENNNLIEIMGIIKPSKTSPNSANQNSIIRGLFTKNAKLLKLLNSCYAEIEVDPNPKEVFKSFLNEFIIWLESDGLIMFEKFYNLFPLAYDYEIFGKPLLHLQKYVEFIIHATSLVRNPFVIDKLNSFSDIMANIIKQYNLHYENMKLNNISFDNIKVFGDSNRVNEKVSSFFRIDQIVDRTKNEYLYIYNDPNKKVELVLLDLANNDEFNALALLAIPENSNSSRSLIFPPFRINELSIHRNNNGDISLSALNFSKSIQKTNEIIISGNKDDLLKRWYEKLSEIFPISSSPVNKEFLIKSDKEFQLSGLGIDTFDYSSTNTTPNNAVSKKASFQDLISSPSLSISPLNQLSKRTITTNTSFSQPSFPQPSSRKNSFGSFHTINSNASYSQPPIAAPFLPRKSSSSSITSMESSDSMRSQYERSLGIIHKTLSNHSLRLSDLLNNTAAVNSAGKNLLADEKSYIKSINRNFLDIMTEDESEHRKSSQAEVDCISYSGANNDKDDKSDYEEEIHINDYTNSSESPYAKKIYESHGENDLVNLSDDYQRKQQNRFSSVPDLSERKTESESSASIYQLSTGSAIDIQNFGKDHNPSFSVHRGLSDLIEPTSAVSLNNSFPTHKSPNMGAATSSKSSINKGRRKSIFGFFKKSSKKPSIAKSTLSHTTNASTTASTSSISLSGPMSSTSSLEPTLESNSSDDTEKLTKPDDFSTNSDPLSNSKQKMHILSTDSSTTTPNDVNSNQKSSEKIGQPSESFNENSTGDEGSLSSVTSDIMPPKIISTSSSSSSNPKNLTIKTDLLEDPLRLSTISEKSDTPTPKLVTASTSLPSPFALPSSTSTYFFKPYKSSTQSQAHSKNSSPKVDHHTKKNSKPDFNEDTIYIPQTLKDVINSDQSVDFYISPSSPKAMKVSKWKQKYGKWEMLTINENVFLKVVANYELNKGWLIFFKEEFDEEYDEVIDKPILLLDINENATIRQSAALDLQINAPDSISIQNILIMIRCTNGSLSSAILSNFNNIVGVLASNGKSKSSKYKSNFELNDSNTTITSSLMDHSKPSNSSTSTSLSLSMNNNDSTIKQQFPHQKDEPILGKDISFASLNSEDITNANIISNPDNNKLLLLHKMTIRLQELDPGQLISVPSSWKILSMYSLSIFLISDNFTNKKYYNLMLENADAENKDSEIENFNWLIPADDKFNRIEQIGKAGMLIKAGYEDTFMIECKGKKEFRRLYELF